MSLLKLFSKLIILVTLYRGCQTSFIAMHISEMKLSDGGVSTAFEDQVLMKASQDSDEYFFMSRTLQRICGTKFTSKDIEIRYVFGPILDFSLITHATFQLPSRHLILTCQFETNEHLQLFYSQLRKTVLLQGPNCISVLKTFLFADNIMVKVAEDNLFYRKPIPKSREVGATMSYNLVRLYISEDDETEEVVETQEADLVFLSRTFNISALIGNDKFAICVARAPNNSIFILRLANARQAWNFFNTVARDLNTDISCMPDDDWIDERIEYIDALEPFNLPNHPYLNRGPGTPTP